MEQSEGHVISIENRKRLTATQIQAVEAFSSSQLVLSYAGGRIIIYGSEMKITSFSKSTGSFSASGLFTAVKYAQKGTGLRQKLFK
ncbi:MAG: hypothetical protein NC131_09520 [Roseburia sp.]|nr:hypothetical protein [Roseburia sp.]